MREVIDKARVLVEALPYIKEFRGKTVVVKIGGAALDDQALRRRFAEDLVLLHWVGLQMVVVHGGGVQVSAMLERLGLPARFVDGIRVTDAATLEVVEMVLGGSLNKELVRLVQMLGGRAVGLTGKDGGLARAVRLTPTPGRDGGDPVGLGLVGEVAAIDRAIIDRLLPGFIPIVAPLAVDADGQTLNVNADPFAAALAVALGAEKLVLLTDTEGVKDGAGSLIPSLTTGDARRLRASGAVSGGMIPKLENALGAVERGVRKVHIIDGRLEHALLLEIFTRAGVGTQFVKSESETG
ncbi:MAG TPA: acetylglutamate kinase [Kofleriaceae bacterium]|nr:acetylglutamate kinase [Kofleriaceae bacterium]